MHCPICGDNDATLTSKLALTRATVRGGGAVCFDPEGAIYVHEDGVGRGNGGETA